MGAFSLTKSIALAHYPTRVFPASRSRDPHFDLECACGGATVRIDRPCGETVEKARCRAAISLLRNSTLGLGANIHRLGCSEYPAFTQAFGRRTGVSPSTCRAYLAQPSSTSNRSA
jgi:AraC-like DNA-binding protein